MVIGLSSEAERPSFLLWFLGLLAIVYRVCRMDDEGWRVGCNFGQVEHRCLDMNGLSESCFEAVTFVLHHRIEAGFTLNQSNIP
jgi:hypothetical protein